MKKIIFSISALMFLLPSIVFAQANGQGWTETECKESGGVWYSNTCLAKPPEVKLQIPIGKLTSGEIDIATYIKTVYTFGVGAITVFSVIMIMVGGFIWLTAGGNQERVTSAKGYITGAVVGIVIGLGSFTVLKIVNPSLVFFAPLKIPMVKQAYLGGTACPEKVAPGEIVMCSAASGGAEFQVKEGKEIICGAHCTIGEGSNAASCIGVGSLNDGKLCLPIAKFDKNHNYVLIEQTPTESCNVQFKQANTKRVGIAQNQSGCDVVNQAMRQDPTPIQKLANKDRGSCVWVTSWADAGTGTRDGCTFCSNERWTQVKLKIEDEAKKDDQTKYELCNETGATWAMTLQDTACWYKFCFGYGGVGPEM